MRLPPPLPTRRRRRNDAYRTGTHAAIRPSRRAAHAPCAHRRLPRRGRGRVLHGHPYHGPVPPHAHRGVSAQRRRHGLASGHRPLRGVLRALPNLAVGGHRGHVPRHPVAAARVLPAGAEAQRAQVVHAHLRRRRGPVHHRHGVLLPHHLEPGVPVAHRPGHGPRLCGAAHELLHRHHHQVRARLRLRLRAAAHRVLPRHLRRHPL